MSTQPPPARPAPVPANLAAAEAPSGGLTSAEFQDLLDRAVNVDAVALLARHPEWLENQDFVLGLAYEDYRRRREAGQSVDIDAFCDRFPCHQSAIRSLLGKDALASAQAHLIARSAWPRAGDVLCSFKLLRELGRGARGHVFLARELLLGERLVVLKVSDFGWTEASTLGKLSHRNIVPVYSVREDIETGLTITCMAYRGTATLHDVLRAVHAGPTRPDRAACILEAARCPDPEPEAAADAGPRRRIRPGDSFEDGIVRLAAELADGLAFLHAQGVCHRDLKPSNVLLEPNGTPLLLDFNLSVDRERQAAILGGTLPYMAPEHLLATCAPADKKPVLVGPRADLFALGVILYELLAGAHPFGPIPDRMDVAEERARLLACQRRGPRRLRGLNPRVDRGLAGLVERCLAYEPEARPASAAEVARELRACLGLRRRALRWADRHRPACAAVVAAVALAGSAGAYTLATRAPYAVRMNLAGWDAYRNADPEAAVRYFTLALEDDPTCRPALRGRIRARLVQADELHRARSRTASAAAKLEHGTRLGQCLALIKQDLDVVITPGLEDAETLLARAYYFSLQGELEYAVAAYRAALEAGAQGAAVLNDFAISLSYQRSEAKLTQALARFNEALRADPDLAPVYRNRALAELWYHKLKPREGYVAQSILDIRRAIELGACTGDVYYDAAQICAVAARTDKRLVDEAVDYLERAVLLGERRTLGDTSFDAIRCSPRFRALLDRAPAADSPESTPHFIDPLRYLPGEVVYGCTKNVTSCPQATPFPGRFPRS